jgi:hypothetical protein
MAADEAEVERELDRLYGLPLDEFTAARNTLARRLRQEGQRARAAAISERRKPTLPAWVVNQLTRKRELDVQRLIKAGEQLGAAQAEAVRGHGADAFLQARKEEQHALQRLASAAREILTDAGRPVDSNLDRVLTTLRAAALTEDGRALLRRGQLAEELDPPGFEAFASIKTATPSAGTRTARRPAPPAAASTHTRAKPRPTKQGAATGQTRKQIAEARRRLRELRAELRTAENQQRQAERRAERLRKQLVAAETDLEANATDRRRLEDQIARNEQALAKLEDDARLA